MEATMEHLPVRVEFVDTVEKVERLMPLLYDMVTDGLIEVQDTVIVKAVAQNQVTPEAPLSQQKT
jgi:PII-like signaling protein